MASADPTQSLLRWGIENAAPDSLLPLHRDIQAGHRPDLNTDVLKAIMGTSDADRMLECVAVIEGRALPHRAGDDKSVPSPLPNKQDQYTAWDDLEMVSRHASISSLCRRGGEATVADLSRCILSRSISQLIEDLDNANSLSLPSSL